MLAQAGRLPDAVIACIGGGSNAIGLFDAFIDDALVRLIGVEAGGEGIIRAGTRRASRAAARRAAGHLDLRAAGRAGNIELTHSVSAGLDYAAIGPEHAMAARAGARELSLRHRRRTRSTAFGWLARSEGCCRRSNRPHAIAAVRDVAARVGRDGILVVNLSGRGDKDVHLVKDLSAAEAVRA
jgi:tryptophan synthase beta chain